MIADAIEWPAFHTCGAAQAAYRAAKRTAGFRFQVACCKLQSYSILLWHIRFRIAEIFRA